MQEVNIQRKGCVCQFTFHLWSQFANGFKLYLALIYTKNWLMNLIPIHIGLVSTIQKFKLKFILQVTGACHIEADRLYTT
jgi:hypothetical protein